MRYIDCIDFLEDDYSEESNADSCCDEEGMLSDYEKDWDKLQGINNIDDYLLYKFRAKA